MNVAQPLTTFESDGTAAAIGGASCIANSSGYPSGSRMMTAVLTAAGPSGFIGAPPSV